MIPITALVALVAVVTSLAVRPMVSLGVLICSMFVYPEYLRVPLGLSEMSVPRLVAVAIVARMLIRMPRGSFRWTWIDRLILLEWVWGIVANCVAGAEQGQLVYMIGHGFDTALIYFAVRLTLCMDNDWSRLVWPLTVCAIWMAWVGVMEAVTYHSPYQALRAYQTFANEWGFEKDLEYRMGMLRAQGSTSHPIYFGMAMTLLTGIIFSLRRWAKHQWVVWVGTVAGFLGALSSLSSGPQTALAMLVLVSLFYLRTGLIKPAVLALVLAAITMEIGSNRHFYYLTEYLNFFGGDYWYRAKLIDVAVARLYEYWPFGFGGRWPHYWGQLIDGRNHVDVVNNFIIIALNSGLTGLAIWVAINAIAIRHACRTWSSGQTRYRQLAFTQAATLIALLVGSISVGLFSLPLLLTYFVLGSMARQPGTPAKPSMSLVGMQRSKQRLGAPASIGF